MRQSGEANFEIFFHLHQVAMAPKGSVIIPAASAAIESSSERAPLLQSSRTANQRKNYVSITEGLLVPKMVVRGLLVLLAFLTAALLSAIVIQEYKDRKDPRWGQGRNYRPVLARGKHGAVAAESERCSRIGVDGKFPFLLSLSASPYP